MKVGKFRIRNYSAGIIDIKLERNTFKPAKYEGLLMKYAQVCTLLYQLLRGMSVGKGKGISLSAIFVYRRL